MRGGPYVASFPELDAAALYRLLRLRVDVFVVEQACPYPELDGRDGDPDTLHVWFADDTGEPVSYLRILTDPDGGARIGRVVTAAHARGKGLSGRLVEAALEIAAGRPVRLAAQTHAAGFYERYGFVASGPEFVEDGIPHVPMERRRP